MTAEQVRAGRLAKRWSQVELGMRAGLHPATVSMLERGGPTSADTIAKVEAALRQAPDSEQTFLGRPMAQPPGAYGTALEKAAGVPALSSDADAEFLADVDELRKSLPTVDAIRALNGPEARTAKAVIAQVARADLDAAERKARDAVAAAKSAADGLNTRLAGAFIPADRAQVIADFEGACRLARVACLAAAAVALQLQATTSDDVERSAVEAKAVAWIDQAAQIVRALGARE